MAALPDFAAGMKREAGGLGLMDISPLEPFDPKKHKPRDVGRGGPSTEISITQKSPDGKVWNIPSLWWDQEGNPVPLKGHQAQRLASEYERDTGKLFPRFNSFEEGDQAAFLRSRGGGATNEAMATNALPDFAAGMRREAGGLGLMDMNPLEGAQTGTPQQTPLEGAQGFAPPMYLLGRASAEQVKKAEEMRGSGFLSLFTGASHKEVFDETGIYQGKDDVWRTIFDDRKSKVNLKGQKTLSSTVAEWADVLPDEFVKERYVKLGDLLDHPELYKAFPDLKDLRVGIYEKGTWGGAGAMYHPERTLEDGTHQMERLDMSITSAKKIGSFQSVLLHEIQHALQKRGDFFKKSPRGVFKLRKTHKEEEAQSVEKAFLNNSDLPPDVIDQLGLDPKRKVGPQFADPELQRGRGAMAVRLEKNKYKMPVLPTMDFRPEQKPIIVELNEQWIAIPTVVDGKELSDEEALQRVFDTQEHLGVFDNRKGAVQYAKDKYDLKMR